MMKRVLLAGLGICAPLALAAHPHVFIETGLRFIVDDAGVLEAVEVSWTYDEFYSLLLLEDMALDPDGDSVLTEAETAQLAGFDMKWVAGFEGDLYLQRAGAPIDLGAAEPLKTELGADGRITTTHRRSVDVAAEGVLAQAYDPGFYTAYDLNGGVDVEGGCMAVVTPVDLNAAYSALEEILYGMPQEQAEVEFPEVGQKFADTVVLQCAS